MTWLAEEERRMHGPPVSIVINNYNYGRFLAAAIDSALAQTYPHAEVIVVDDGSTDDSREVLAAYRGWVTAVLKPNGGQASAFNAGFAVCRGEVVFFLDADDLLLPGAVAEVVPCFADAGVVKAHWPMWVVDELGRPTGEVLPAQPLAEGDLREVVLRDGPDSCQGMPTSGNAWSRAFLSRVLPAPEPEYRQGADGYLLTLAPLYGTVRRVGSPQGCYRVHGGNQYWCAATDERVARSLVRYERRSRTLAGHLRGLGLEPDPEGWKQRNPYYQWLERLRRATEELKAVVPAGETFVLADEGQWGAEVIADRQALPYLERGGQYWGPPPDDVTAVGELERLRRQGAGFAAFGWPAFWWLEHYAGLRRHLRAGFPCVLENERLVVFDLRRGGGAGE